MSVTVEGPGPCRSRSLTLCPVVLLTQLFDHIAACLAEFLDSQKLRGQTLPLGFTFSFPCEQKEIDKVCPGSAAAETSLQDLDADVVSVCRAS